MAVWLSIDKILNMNSVTYGDSVDHIQSAQIGLVWNVALNGTKKIFSPDY